MKEIWDKKASSYTRFNGELSAFQREFFAKLDEFGVKFEGKTLLDVGCGTGVYTLYLAKMCKNVTGLDLSEKMLECMSEDAKKFGVSNLKIVQSGWDKYSVDQIYDIAFSTMSPAISNATLLDKFINAGKTRVFMWWNKQRHSNILERFYKIYGDREWSDRFPQFEYHLERLNIPVKSHILDEVRTRDLDFEKAYGDTIWHLEIGEVKFSEDEVKSELLKMSESGKIREIVTSSMKLLVF